MNQIKRRGFLSCLLPVLASIPVVGKLFANDSNRFGEQQNEEYLNLVGEIGSAIRGSGSDGKNSFGGEWISVNDRLPEKQEKTLAPFEHSSPVLLRHGGKISIGRWIVLEDNKISWEFPIFFTPTKKLSRLISTGLVMNEEPTHWAELPEGPRQ